MPKKLSELSKAELKDQIRKYSLMVRDQPGEANLKKVLGYLHAEQIKREEQDSAVATLTQETTTRIDRSLAMRRSQRMGKTSQRVVTEVKTIKKTPEKKDASRRIKKQKNVLLRILFILFALGLAAAVGACVYVNQVSTHKAANAISHFINDHNIPVRYESISIHPIDRTVTFTKASLKTELLDGAFSNDKVECKTLALLMDQDSLINLMKDGSHDAAMDFNMELSGLQLTRNLPDHIVETHHMKDMLLRVSHMPNSGLSFHVLSKNPADNIKDKEHWIELCAWFSKLHNRIKQQPIANAPTEKAAADKPSP